MNTGISPEVTVIYRAVSLLGSGIPSDKTSNRRGLAEDRSK